MRELNPPAHVRQAEDLVTLFATANAEYGQSEQLIHQGRGHCARAGDALLKARERCQYGSWLKTLKDHWKHSQQRASQCMQLAKLLAASNLTPEEAEEEWQRIQGHRPKEVNIEEAPAPVPDPLPQPPRQPEPTTPEWEPETEVPEEDLADGEEKPEQPEGEDHGGNGKADPDQAPPRPDKPARTPLPESPPETQPSPRGGGKLGKAGEFITITEWSGMADSGKREALARRGGGQFNPQSGDSIEWALWSWNPVTGCRHDCPYCYARDIADRLYTPKFEPSLWPARIRAPHNTTFPAEAAAEWLGHKNVFTCSMADLFGRWVPEEWIAAVLKECAAALQWNFLFLTKFPNRMSEFAFPDNCWVGTTVDCQARVKNAEKSFRKVKANVKWLSCEPLLEPLRFTDLGAFQWVVIGGASRSRETPPWQPPNRWITSLKSAAWAAGVKVYEKTNLYPTDIGEVRVREYPGVDQVESKPAASLIYLPQEIG